MTGRHLVLAATLFAAVRTLPAQTPVRAPMVDSLRHAPGKLVRNADPKARPTTLRAVAECSKVRLPPVGSDSTGSYFGPTVTGFVPPKSATFPKEFPFQFWLHVDAKGKLVATEYLRKPGKEFEAALLGALKKATFAPAIYRDCAVDGWVIGQLNAVRR